MPSNLDMHHRRSVRLKGYDYSQPGSYFVTVCTNGHECLLGEIIHGAIVLNGVGLIARAAWEQLPDHYPHVLLDSFVIMPNRVHGIIVLNDDLPPVGAPLAAPSGGSASALPDSNLRDVGASLALPGKKGAASGAPTLGDVIRVFKSMSAIRVNRLLARTGQHLWQRNYYEHVIRNEIALNAIREYIEKNPSQWQNDQDNPDIIRLMPLP